MPLVPLLLSLLLYANFDKQSPEWQFAEHAEWMTLRFPVYELSSQSFTTVELPIAYELAVDGISLPLVIMTTIVGSLSAIASWGITHRVREYFLFYFLLEIGMAGVFVAQNLLLFFIFFELTLIALFFLVGIWGFANRERAAYQLLIYNGIGSIIMLLAFAALFVYAQSFNFQEVADRLTVADVSESIRYGLFIALLIAFGIKLPIFPFHTWVPNVHPEASPAISMILSGVLLKMGAYGLIRFGVGFFPDIAANLSGWIAGLGLVNLLYGALLALVQRDLKRVVAYSSISHMGIVLFGIAALNVVGMQGAVFQMVSHGFISALMFFLAGVIYARTGTTAIDELGGLARPMPFVGGVFLTAAMASLGLPFLSGFVGEVQAYVGLFMSEWKVIAVIGTLGLILTAAYLLRIVLTTTFGPTPSAWQALSDARPVEVVPMMTLVALIVLIGVYPIVLSEPLNATLMEFLNWIGG